MLHSKNAHFDHKQYISLLIWIKDTRARIQLANLGQNLGHLAQIGNLFIS